MVMTLRVRTVVVKQEHGYWAYVPGVPGVYGAGRTPASAKKDLAKAVKLYTEDCLEDGDPIPFLLPQVVEQGEIAVTV